ncbi:hypothetical protein CR513_23633, partial [Mucuna pruriens]
MTHDEVTDRFTFEYMVQKVILKPLSPREKTKNERKERGKIKEKSLREEQKNGKRKKDSPCPYERSEKNDVGEELWMKEFEERIPREIPHDFYSPRTFISLKNTSAMKPKWELDMNIDMEVMDMLRGLKEHGTKAKESPIHKSAHLTNKERHEDDLQEGLKTMEATALEGPMTRGTPRKLQEEFVFNVDPRFHYKI